MDAVLRAGNELIAGRENAPGSKEVKEEMDTLKDRMDIMVATSNERNGDLEHKWNTVKYFDDCVNMLNVQLKQKLEQIDVLMTPGSDARDIYNELKVRIVFYFIFFV